MTAPRENPIPEYWVADGLVSADAAVAYDAYEAQDPRALQLMVGLPATISIGADSYAAQVVRATRTTLVAAYGVTEEARAARRSYTGRDKEEVVFRLTKRGWSSRRSYRLAVGQAINHRPQEV